jgi:hypothetical protein
MLHGIQPEGTLTELIRVMPVWPRDRYLELAPKHWKATRARLPENALVPEYGLVFERPLCVALDGFPPSGITKHFTLRPGSVGWAWPVAGGAG